MNNKLIITIVKRGLASKIVEKTRKLGAEGGTILLGLGATSEDVYRDILGIRYEPEKEIILTVVKEDLAESILDGIREFAGLDQPGMGISFIINLKYLKGICHLFAKEANNAGN